MATRRSAFTLFELMVVVIIVSILAGTVVMLMSQFMRGQGVRQAGNVVTSAVAQAKQHAVMKHQFSFLVFSPQGQDAWMEIHEDVNKDGVYQGDQDPKSQDGDKRVAGGKIDLPKNSIFENAPVCMTFSPSGYVTFSGGFQEVQASTFDAAMNGASPKPIGDVIVRIRKTPYVVCIDLDRAGGKVRKFQFLNEGGGP